MISINHMTFGYTSSCKIFHDVSAEILPGRIYGLLGKNGVGKSTLFRLICGANVPSRGSLSTLGFEPGRREPSMLNQLYLLPENMTMPSMSLMRFVDVYAPFYPQFSRDDFSHLIDIFGLDGSQRMSEMSLGQCKKSVISFAMASHTKILLMDEPTNGLDIPGKRMFREALSEMKDPNRLMIISTHQVRDLEQLIDAVLVVDEGSILVNTTVEALCQRYRFGVIDSKEPPMYEERVAGQRVGIMRREKDAQRSEIDLELLFNAVIERALPETQLQEGDA